MTSIDRRLIERHKIALDEIVAALSNHESLSNWVMPDEIAHFIYDLMKMAPANAKRTADDFRAQRIQDNEKARLNFEKAVAKQKELARSPWTDTGGQGIFSFLLRQLLSFVNSTPFSGLNRLEINQDGLQIYQPFRTVSTRTIRHADLDGRNVVLSVNPPAYFDFLLGLFGQFRLTKDISSPWGQLVLYEPGSGQEIGAAVVLWPSEKKKTIEDTLKQLHLANNRFEGYKRVPNMTDLFDDYDTEGWDDKLNGWLNNSYPLMDEERKLLQMSEKPERKRGGRKGDSESKWSKRMGCLLAGLLFFLFIVVWPILWLLGFILRRLGFRASP